MSLENQLREEIRKRKQQQRNRTGRRIGLLLLILGVVIGFAYLSCKGVLSFRISSPAISTAIPLLSSFGLILICSLAIYVIKYQGAKFNFSSKFSLSTLELLQFSRLKRIKPKYFLGFTLLFIVLIYQGNSSLINNPVSSFFTRLVHKPAPPVLNSPWSWKEHEVIHPIVANMPSNVETSIESVAKYITQQESDPYLRIKALHDYVISRVTYDLEVLKTGIRPPQNAQNVFFTHKAVCEGYANLFMALGRASGTDVVFLRGKIRRDLAPIGLIPKRLRLLRSNYDWTLHAWNAVKVADNWQLVDTTWDDSESARTASSYRADYLMPPPQVMIMSHFPDQSDWQLLHQPKDQESFENQPILTPQFFIEELVLISPTEYQTNVHKQVLIKIKNSQNYHKKIVAIFAKRKESGFSFWDLPEGNPFIQEKQQDIERCQSQQNAEGVTKISCQFPEPGDYQVLMFSLKQEIGSIKLKISPIGQLRFHAR